jgi:hypothetical protein
LELGGNLMVGGGSLCCDSLEGRVLFYRLRGSRTGEWGVETKGRELKVKLNRLGIQDPLRKCFWKRVVVSHRILTFGHTGILLRV